jgi:hypothetical protein
VSDRDLDDLPGLSQWGDDLREATRRAEEQRARRRWHVPARRLGVALAAMFLVVPGAVATRSIWDDPVEKVAPTGPGPQTPTVRLRQGSNGGVVWRIGGYDGPGAKRCLRFDALRSPVGAVKSTGCAAPETAAGLTVQVSTFATVAFVFGTTAESVDSVDVALHDGRHLRVPTTGIAPEVLRRSRLRPGIRIYVAAVAGGFSTQHAPRVSGRDAAGRTVGSLPQ